jgi:HlyD family secretion protein
LWSLEWSFLNNQDETLSLYGNVDIRTVKLNLRVAERLSSLGVDEGDSVKPGASVAKLVPAPLPQCAN